MGFSTVAYLIKVVGHRMFAWHIPSHRKSQNGWSDVKQWSVVEVENRTLSTRTNYAMQNLVDIEQRLEMLGNQIPLVLRHLVSVEFLQRVDGSS